MDIVNKYGGKPVWREGGREEGREGGRKGGRERGRERAMCVNFLALVLYVYIILHFVADSKWQVYQEA